MSEKEVMACTTMAEKTSAMMRGKQVGSRMLRRKHPVQQRLRGIGQHQAGHAVDGHQPHPGEQQPFARGHQRPNLRPQFLQVGLALGQLRLPRSRSAPMRRALGAHAHAHPAAPHRAHALHLPRAPRRNERQQAQDHSRVRIISCPRQENKEGGETASPPLILRLSVFGLLLSAHLLDGGTNPRRYLSTFRRPCRRPEVRRGRPYLPFPGIR